MKPVVVFVVSGAVAWVITGGTGLVGHPALRRENYRGAPIATGAGVALVLAAVAVDAALVAADVARTGTVRLEAIHLFVLAAVAGFGLLGLLDDLLGDARHRGLRGHLAAARHGEVTTGFIKLAGGLAFAIVLAAAAGPPSRPQLLADAAVIAAAANLGNLLDRAPGRAIKWSLVAYVPLAVVAGTGPAATAAAAIAGGAAGLLHGDLRERFMLGDAGANPLGAGLGMAAVLTLGAGARVATAVVLVAMTLVSERVSFGRVIRATPPLRLFDDLGRSRVEGGSPGPA